ncbi:hypothetical protein JCM15060_08920 [Halanaerobaculum tunisiense]
MHQHKNKDEIFYCVQSSGTGILEEQKHDFTVGDTFVGPASKNHTVQTNTEMHVVSILVPKL